MPQITSFQLVRETNPAFVDSLAAYESFRRELEAVPATVLAPIRAILIGVTTELAAIPNPVQ
jgi:hypothetical protein